MPLALLRILILRMVAKFSKTLQAFFRELQRRRKCVAEEKRDKRALKKKKPKRSSTMVSRGTQAPRLPELGFDRSESLSSAVTRVGCSHHGTQTPYCKQVSLPVRTKPQDPTKRIDRLLPPELLDLVCDHLSTADVCAFRAVNRKFRDGSRTAFARRADERSFAVNCIEMESLERRLDENGCGPYMNTLRIDTGVTCTCQRQDWLMWIQKNRYTLHSARDFCDFDRVRRDNSKCGLALSRIVRRMPHLQTIELAMRQRSWSVVNVRRMGGVSAVAEYVEPYFAITRWASWRALDALVRAFDGGAGRQPLPKPKDVVLNGLFTADALTNPLKPCPDTRLFSHLTRCTVSIAQSLTGPGQASQANRNVHLPSFLAMLPSTLTHLNLLFPKDNISRPQLLSSYNGQPFTIVHFSDEGMQALIERNIHFPQLHTFHLTNLSLSDADTFQNFLAKHSATLRCLSLTAFALTVRDWRPFLEFFRTKMQLQKFQMDSQLTDAERIVQHRLWETVPAEQRIKRVDYHGVAKEMLLNGRQMSVEETSGGDDSEDWDEA